jgi:hypothetical protein
LDTTQTAADEREIRPPSHTCNARNRTGGYCLLEAGFGTDHFGSGRCKFHGGATGGRPPTTGTQAKKHTRSIRERAEELAKDDPVLALHQSLSQGRAFFEAFLDSVNDDPENISNEAREHAVLILNHIGKTVERIERIRNSNALTVAELRLYEAKLGAAIGNYLTDPATRGAFLRDVAAILSGPESKPRTVEALPANDQAQK